MLHLKVLREREGFKVICGDYLAIFVSKPKIS
jgi:hypothetical protein